MAIDVCFDPQFSCSHAEPFVGTAMILAKSEGDPQTGKQASVRIEGSDRWLPALVPVHAPRGSRRTTSHPVPVVGCLIENGSRFVLSWADMRCRSSTSSASFPAECDGASQRDVAIENTTAAIMFVDGIITQVSNVARRKLDLGDIENTFVRGKKTAIMVLISPSDATNALDSWNYGIIASDFGGSPNAWVDAVVRETPQSCHRLSPLLATSSQHRHPSPPLLADAPSRFARPHR